MSWRNTVRCFFTGTVGYPLLEMVARGHTHWSMALTGGVCLVGIFCIHQQMRGRPLIVRAAVGALLITAVEFLVGLLVNCVMHWNVWDYSDRPLNLLGQVCPTFTGIWFVLCVCAFFALDRMEQYRKNVTQNVHI